METGAFFETDPAGRACRFRVWAPDAPQVTLELPQRRESRPLAPERDGYWSAAFPDIAGGEDYRFRLGDGPPRPDPASRHQPEGVHGPSRVWDPSARPRRDGAWRGLPLEDMVMYELHVGTFTAEGTFAAVAGRLDHLADLGVNALEIMPVAQFPGVRGWGYDGACPFAAQASYGGPDGLRDLVEACHARGFAVILDVVYNHLGPEGTYLHEFGPYFTDRYRTPWGRALNFDGPDSGPVREYFIGNALYWFRDIGVDALRLDAIHQVHDASARPFLADLAERVQEFSRQDGRERYLVAESDLNDVKVVRDRASGGFGMHAQWLDDFHHAVDTLLLWEKSDYRRDYGHPAQLLKAWRNGYVYSGEYCPTRKQRHGNSSAGRPGREFVIFIQNHDQVGNRPTGERISRLCGSEAQKLAAGAILLSPYIPLLFMGEEYGETAPFLFFADYGDEALREAVREGRKREFGFLSAQGEPPDPMAESSFLASKLDWARPAQPGHRAILAYYRALIRLRRSEPSLRKPSKEHLEVSGLDRTFVMRRLLPGQGQVPLSEVQIAFNFDPAETRLRLQAASGEWEKVLDSAEREWDGPGSQAPARLKAGDAFRLNGHALAVYRRV